MEMQNALLTADHQGGKAKKAPPKLLAVGGMRTVAERVDHPIVYYVPGSFNSGKATLASAISSKASVVEKRLTLHFRDNYKIEYARLNPDTMAVPTMQIDDKVITDSFDLCKYLYEKYPGPGDQQVAAAGKVAEMEMWAFIDIVKEWDEFMYTYGTQMSQSTSDFLNGIRLTNLRYYLCQLLKTNPPDTEFLTEKYVRKIAGITVMKDAQCDGEAKTKAIADNRAQLWEVLALVNQKAAQYPNGFLFGDNLTTADVFVLPIFRLMAGDPALLQEAFQKNPALEGYWTRALATPEVQKGLMADVSKRSIVGFMCSTMAPKTMLAYKLGCLPIATLPQEIEDRIAQATIERWAVVRGS